MKDKYIIINKFIKVNSTKIKKKINNEKEWNLCFIYN